MVAKCMEVNGKIIDAASYFFVVRIHPGSSLASSAKDSEIAQHDMLPANDQGDRKCRLVTSSVIKEAKQSEYRVESGKTNKGCEPR